MNSKKILTILTVGALSFTVKAGESQTAEAKDSLLNQWDIPQLYSDSESSLLNDLKLVGRYEWQYGDVNFDEGDYSGWTLFSGLRLYF